MDELHMLDDESRGYIMELMATKLMSLEHDIQLIGMSATLSVSPPFFRFLGSSKRSNYLVLEYLISFRCIQDQFLMRNFKNAKILATWLNDARFYQTGYRPIPIKEYLVYENNVYNAASSTSFYNTATQLNSQVATKTQKNVEPVRTIIGSKHKEYSNPVVNSVVALATETAKSGYGALVFCSSRLGCETNAELISRAMPRLEELDEEILEKRQDVVRDLRSLMTGMEHIIEKVLPYGVAFHRKFLHWVLIHLTLTLTRCRIDHGRTRNNCESL